MDSNKQDWTTFFSKILDLANEYNFIWDAKPDKHSLIVMATMPSSHPLEIPEIKQLHIAYFNKPGEEINKGKNLGVGTKKGECQDFGFYFGSMQSKYEFLNPTELCDSLEKLGFNFNSREKMEVYATNFKNSLKKVLKGVTIQDDRLTKILFN